MRQRDFKHCFDVLFLIANGYPLIAFFRFDKTNK